MKYLVSLVAIVTVLTACNNNKKSFTVNGSIQNGAHKMAYLEEAPLAASQPFIVDSAAIENGKFTLKTDAVEDAVYNIRVDALQFPVASLINDVPEADVTIVMSTHKLGFPEKYEVKNSPASEAMSGFVLSFNNQLMEIVNQKKKIDSLSALPKADSSIGAAVAKQKELGAALKQYLDGEIKKGINPALSMFQLGYYQSTANEPGLGIEPFDNKQVIGFIDEVSKKFPKHIATAGLKLNLQQQMQALEDKTWIGKQAPDISLPNPSGQPVSLSSLKGKYVLVDFWASWCRPCRAENPNIVAAFAQYANKGFIVFGVSLDDDAAAWKNAIENDKLNWPQVSDLKKWESPVVAQYKFNGIPFNVLVDPQGKIVAEGLRGPALQETLARLLP